MSLRIRRNRSNLDVVPDSTVAWKLNSWRAGPTGQNAATLVTSTAARSRLGTVLAVVGAGLLMQGVGDALARTGHRWPVLALFLLGLLVIFTPCAWRLTSANTTRTERIWVSLVLGAGLLASYIIRSPLILDGFDELAHGATLMRLLDGRSPFPTNTVLPVSPYFPGLELVTIATKWLTGLPLLLDQQIVLMAARIVLVLCVFLIVERACRSSRAGGVGVLAFAASPQFYSFDAQYAYETVALAFAVAVVYLLFVSIDASRPRKGGLFALALVCIGAMVVTHHLTAWLTIGFLAVWAVGLRLTVDHLARPLPDHVQPPLFVGGRLPFQARGLLQHGQPTRRTDQARIVGLAAMVGLVIGGAWVAFVGHVLIGYVGPILGAAVGAVSSAVGHLHGNRQLFQNAAGGGSPGWEIALMLAAAVCWCLILLTSLYSVIWKRSVRGGRLRYLPAVIAAAYPLALLASISSASAQVGGRATTFIFFGVAVVVGGWLARRLSMDRRSVEQIGTIAVAAVCFLGSTLYGGGPLSSYVPGPYILGADARSVGSPSLALAQWVATYLPMGSHVAVDRDNGALLNDIGHVDPVTAIGGLVNPAPLFFDTKLSPFDISLVRRADIRYIVIDTRLAEGAPLYGSYIAPGESRKPTRLTLAELDKFNSIPGIRRIYDNGPIQVYDLASLLGKPPLAGTAGPIGASRGTGLDLGVLLVAILAAVVWLIRLRRLRLLRVDEHVVVCGVVGAMAISLFGAFVIRLTHLPPGLIALIVLLGLLILGLHPVSRGPRFLRTFPRWPAPLPGLTSSAAEHVKSRGFNSARPAEITTYSDNHQPALGSEVQRRSRRSRSQIALGCIGLALFAIGASLATVTARKEWIPPPELSAIHGPAGQLVAGVRLGSAGPIAARLEVITGGRVLWSSPLSRNTAAQSVVLPVGFLHLRSHVLLVSNGHILREVDG